MAVWSGPTSCHVRPRSRYDLGTGTSGQAVFGGSPANDVAAEASSNRTTESVVLVSWNVIGLPFIVVKRSRSAVMQVVTAERAGHIIPCPGGNVHHPRSSEESAHGLTDPAAFS